MSSDDKMKKLCDKAKALYNQKQRLSYIKIPYISEQTGIPEKKIKTILNLRYEGITEAQYSEYNELIDKIIAFLFKEEYSGSYCFMPNTDFYELHQALRKEFDISNEEQIRLIEKRINDNYGLHKNLQRIALSIEFMDFKIKRHGVDKLIDEGGVPTMQAEIRKLYHELSEYDYLRIYGENTVVGEDEEGNTIDETVPITSEEHASLSLPVNKIRDKIKLFEDNINAVKKREDEDYSDFLRYHEENSDTDYDIKVRLKKSKTNLFVQAFNRGPDKVVFTTDQQKAILEVYLELCLDMNRYLLPEHYGSGIEICFNLGYDNEDRNEYIDVKRINKITYLLKSPTAFKYSHENNPQKLDESDKIYKFIANHKSVFFHDPCGKYMNMLIRKIAKLPKEAKEKVRALLREEFGLLIPNTHSTHLYYKTLSQYLDILSMRTPVADISRCDIEQIYCTVYEMQKQKRSGFTFSNELVELVYQYIKLNSLGWTWCVHISYYYFKHGEIDSLIRYIDEVSKEDLQ